MAMWAALAAVAGLLTSTNVGAQEAWPGTVSGPWPGTVEGARPGTVEGPWPGAVSGPWPGAVTEIARAPEAAAPEEGAPAPPRPVVIVVRQLFPLPSTSFLALF
ncbi:MAG: hypothetical protein IT372_32565 [Polyangiaceae bacterium]|nr:hypothetical protein [Polyangiaceae bacterium]